MIYFISHKNLKYEIEMTTQELEHTLTVAIIKLHTLVCKCVFGAMILSLYVSEQHPKLSEVVLAT